MNVCVTGKKKARREKTNNNNNRVYTSFRSRSAHKYSELIFTVSR